MTVDVLPWRAAAAAFLAFTLAGISGRCGLSFNACANPWLALWGWRHNVLQTFAP